jgi:lysophospholipase L1-like esterase
MRSRRRIALDVLLVVIATLAAFVLCELLARALVPADPASAYIAERRRHNRDMRARFYQFDPVLGWRHRKNGSGRFEAPDFSCSVHIDGAGHRVQPTAPAKPERRLLVLGDSIAFGYGVDDERAFPARFAASHPAIAVENLAVSGYGTDQELLAIREELERRGPPSQPTSVLVTFYLNDLVDVLHDSAANYKKPRFDVGDDGALTLRNVPLPAPEPAEPGGFETLDGRLSAGLRVYGLLRPSAENLLALLHLQPRWAAVDDYLGFFVVRAAPERARLWHVWRSLMNEIAGETRAAGYQPLVLVVPVKTQVEADARSRLEELYGYREDELDLEEPERTILAWGANARVPVIAALPAMRAAAATAPVYFEFDMHPNARGQQVLADVLDRYFHQYARR